MGVVYKLKPEIRDAIIHEAQAHPDMGCRKLALLLEAQFKVAVSKSSINYVLKETGLSQPVGRRIIHKRRKRKVIPEQHNPVTGYEMIPPASAPEVAPLVSAVEKDTPPLLSPPAQLPEIESKAPEAILIPPVEAGEDIVEETVVPDEQSPGVSAPSPGLEPELPVGTDDQTSESSSISAQPVIPLPAIPDARNEEQKGSVAAEGPVVSAVPVSGSDIHAAPEECIVTPAVQETSGQESVTHPDVDKQSARLQPVMPLEMAEVQPDAAGVPENGTTPVSIPVDHNDRDKPAPGGVEPAGYTPVEAPSEPPENEETSVGAGDACVTVPVEEGQAALQPVPADAVPSQKAAVPEISQASVPDTALPNAGAWFLKAADLYSGGMDVLVDAVQQARPDVSREEARGLSETLFYSQLFEGSETAYGQGKPWVDVSCVVESQYSGDKITAFKDTFLSAAALSPAIVAELEGRMTMARAIRFKLKDATSFYIDGNQHSVWASSYVPDVFSVPLRHARTVMEACAANASAPLVIQAHPGLAPSNKVFCAFLQAFEGNPDKEIQEIVFYGQGRGELAAIPVKQGAKRAFIIGLFPSQLPAEGRVPVKGAPKEFFDSATGNAYQLFDGHMAFQSAGSPGESVVRRICVSNKGKDCVHLVTNLSGTLSTAEEIAALYLSRWPGLGSGYEDFLNKMECIYKPVPIDEAKYPDKMALRRRKAGPQRFDTLWFGWLDTLCSEAFFPSEYKEADFKKLFEVFYSAQGLVNVQNGQYTIILIIDQRSQFKNDVCYACERVNERGITLPSGSRLFFRVKPA